jgi:pimeloyl-ACP methyl ester carboxylesterase/DNA-binding winged helix-turn-helix (wHTH) protein
MIYRFSDCELDTGRQELRRAGVVRQVEPQVFELLRYLVERPDQFISKDEMFSAVWQRRIVSDAALASRVKAARQAIGDSGAEQRLIRTVHGRGIRFVAPVQCRDEHDGDRGVAAPSRASQEIRYCQAVDGTRIAYGLCGEGPPLVKAANWLNHLEMEWQSPLWRHWLDALSAQNTLVRYDERGNGLSDWDVEDITFDAFVSDLETVVDAAGLERFALLGISQGSGVSVAYAARHPERVSHLILLGGYAQGWRARGNPHEIARHEAMATLISDGWGQDNPAFLQVFTSLRMPRCTPEQMRWLNDLTRGSTSAESARRLHEAFGHVDVTGLLDQVKAPTLVVHATGDAVAPFDQAKVMAAGIPGARLVPLDSVNHMLLADEPAWPVFVQELRRFLATERALASGTAPHGP